MKPGYIYIENGVVWNEKMKPTFLDFPEIFFDNMSRYEPALKQWQEACVEVENAELLRNKAYIRFTKHGAIYEISSGQKAFIDGKTIVKLG